MGTLKPECRALSSKWMYYGEIIGIKCSDSSVNISDSYSGGTYDVNVKWWNGEVDVEYSNLTGFKKLNDGEENLLVYIYDLAKLKDDDNREAFRTISPLKTDLGYKGYGVLWWEVKDYVKLTANIFLCNVKKHEDIQTFTFSNFPDTQMYEQSITLSTTTATSSSATINFNDISYLNCKNENPFANGVPVTNDDGCYTWIMWLPKGTYKIKGSTSFTQYARYYDNSSWGCKYDSEEVYNEYKDNKKEVPTDYQYYKVDLQNESELYIATKLDGIVANLKVEKYETVWEEGRTSYNLLKYYDQNYNCPYYKEIGATYKYQPNDSMAYETVNGYIIKLDHTNSNLDAADVLDSVGNTLATLDNYTTWSDYEYQGNLHGWGRLNLYNYCAKSSTEHTGETKKTFVGRASCYTYIYLQNLKDILSEEAKNYVPDVNADSTGKITFNIELSIRSWCQKGDFGSSFKNLFGLKDNNLNPSMSLQKLNKSTHKWEDIYKINTEELQLNEESKKEDIGKDGMYTFDYEIKDKEIKKTIEYDDDIRICFYTPYISKKSEAATITIKSVNVNTNYKLKTE